MRVFFFFGMPCRKSSGHARTYLRVSQQSEPARIVYCNRQFVRARTQKSVAAVHRDDARAAEAEVVLQRDLRAVDLTRFRLATQVPDELGALREAGRAERMTLR